MNQTALTKLEIYRDLSFLQETELQALKIVIEKMVNKTTEKSTQSSLKGIWRDKGFERLGELESALRQVREEMNASILKRSA